jgi:hypothetical protein
MLRWTIFTVKMSLYGKVSKNIERHMCIYIKRNYTGVYILQNIGLVIYKKYIFDFFLKKTMCWYCR